MVASSREKQSSPNPSTVILAGGDVSRLTAMIRQCLDHYDYEDAIFLAELQFSQDKSDSSLHTLTDAYYRCGKTAAAYSLLRRHSPGSAQTKHLLARCCIDMEKLDEAEQVLLSVEVPNGGANCQGSASTSLFVRRLLADIYCKTDRHDMAMEELKTSIKTNPLLWSAMEKFCQIGDKKDFPKVTRSATKPMDSTEPRNVEVVSQETIAVAAPQQKETRKHVLGVFCNDIQTPSPNLMRLPTSDTFSSSATPSPFLANPSVAAAPTAPKAPKKQAGGAVRRGKVVVTSASQPSLADSLPTTAVTATISPPRITRNSSRLQMVTTNTATTTAPPVVVDDSSSVVSTRRSTRLFDSAVTQENGRPATNRARVPAAPSVLKKTRQARLAELNKENPGNGGGLLIEDCFEDDDKKKRSPTATRAKANNLRRDGETIVFDGAKTDDGDTGAAGKLSWDDQHCKWSELVEIFGRARIALALYEWESAIEIIREDMPESLRTSPMGLQMLARAYFEATNYPKCCEVYEALRLRYDHYLGGVDIYSTALWHLQKERELSALSQQLSAAHKSAPETWCVTGNCFSLQKEHLTAIQFFNRAIQLDSNFAYAYTLLGHEYLSLDDYDRSRQAFRSAIRLTPRQYAAWYGLGLIEFRREQLLLARLHFERAVAVNGRNSILRCHLSVVDQALGRPTAALRHLDAALATTPQNGICRYYRAQLLFSHGRLHDALEELERLKLLVHNEPKVFFLAGKLHKKLDQTHLALMNFNWAMELDPKGEQNGNPLIGDRRYDDEPVTALAAIDPTEVGELEAIDGDLSPPAIDEY